MAQTECRNISCGRVFDIEEGQTFATCPKCGTWYRIDSLQPGPALPLIFWALLTATRIAIVLWLPILVLTLPFSAFGASAQPLLVLGSFLIPGIAIWYWLKDWKRRTNGVPLGLPSWLPLTMRFIGKSLRWGFGWFLTTFGQKAYYLFLTMMGQKPGELNQQEKCVPYRVAFAVSYGLAFILFSTVFIFFWGAPPPEQITFYNILILGITLETSVSLGFVLSFAVWPLLLIIESSIPNKIRQSGGSAANSRKPPKNQ